MAHSLTFATPSAHLAPTPDPEVPATRTRLAGFFPGLGSRSFHQDLDRFLLDSGIPEVTAVYRDAAQALDIASQPERLLLTPGNLPADRLERQGFIGAALLVHGLALNAFLRHSMDRNATPGSVVAYTGESFGILTAAVAAGALPLADGVRIAQAFTPILLLTAGAADPVGPLAAGLVRHLPAGVRRAPLVPEPSHVVAVDAPDPASLAALLDALAQTYPVSDVELHKWYSPSQANLYVRAAIRPAFDQFLTASFPTATARDLKEPTVFLAHSARMRPARQALEHFIDAHGIRFASPGVPVIDNSGLALLTTAADVRHGVLAMADQPMASSATCTVLDGLDLDLVLELGPGGKSVQLLRDNTVSPPAFSFTGDPEETASLLRSISAVDRLVSRLEDLPPATMSAQPEYDAAREVLRLAAGNEFCDLHLSRTLERLVSAEMLRPGQAGSPARRRLLEVLQLTRKYREHIRADRGELVTRARLKKHFTSENSEPTGATRIELQVIDPAGRTTAHSYATSRPEVIAFHFDALTGVGPDVLAQRARRLLDTQPAALGTYRQLRAQLPLDLTGIPRAELSVLYQVLLFETLRQLRPALFSQTDHYLEGSGVIGWLAALAASGAISLEDVLAVQAAATKPAVLEGLLARITEARIPLVSLDGVPIQSPKDLCDATLTVLRGGTSSGAPRRVHLNGNCLLLSLGSALHEGRVDVGPHTMNMVTLVDPAEAWQTGPNPALDDAEYECLLGLTEENARVLETARSRRMLPSTVNAYLSIDEAVTGFGKGGSESLTVFVRKDGETRTTVRKILSEALTTARWDPHGSGVMLPPFTKARKQADYLQALPAPVRRYFPEVHRILERSLPVAPHLRQDGRSADREVIYEMSYLAGDEVSRFVEKHTPPPAVVARLYQEIIRVLHEDVHSVGRVPAPGETLDFSYFRKIEDRLALCRRTAPATFNDHLLATERITVNDVSYLNSTELLRRYRATPEYLRLLEPNFHSLVMGDTNTENIKVTNTEPLLHAQRLIDSGAPETETDAALEAITATALGIKFLDPRAIGFKSDGRETRDDAMYDNKPWHNSIGHYDEIHFEQFTMDVQAGAGRTPSVDIRFHPDNPYQRAYRVRDVTATGGTVNTAEPQGIEDYFAPVMTAALQLDNPRAAFAKQDPYWLIRFVFMMGQHFTAMPPFHFQKELDGTLMDTYQDQRRPVAIYCEGVKWLNWALQMLEGARTEFLGIAVPPLPHLRS